MFIIYEAGRIALISLFVCMLYPQSMMAEEHSQKREEPEKYKTSLFIDGENVNYINIAFNDYIAGKGDYYRDVLTNIRYYKFSIVRNNDSIIVGFGLDQVLLKKEKGLMFKGGGAEYTFKNGSTVIYRKIRFK